MKNTSTVEKRQQAGHPTRSLSELVRLIKQDLKEMQNVEMQEREQEEVIHEKFRDQILRCQKAIGEKLLEAKTQLKHGEFQKWIRANFPSIGASSAMEYMGMVKLEKHSGEYISGVQDYRKKRWRKLYEKNKTGTSKWRNEVQQRLDAFEAQRFNLEVEETNREKEHKLVAALALEIISIGYKVLATKLHPDKKGGSHEGMQRLNAARDMLKGVVSQ